MSDLELYKILIDPEFYRTEAHLNEPSLDGLAQHFKAKGQFDRLNPSSLFMWSWAPPELFPSIDRLGEVQEIVAEFPLHPLFHVSLLRSMIASGNHTLWSLLRMLKGKSAAQAPLHPAFAAECGAALAQPLDRFLEQFSRLAQQDNQVETKFFSADWYLAVYADVRQANLNPFRHFIERGWKEGRDPSPFFCTQHYIEDYHDRLRPGRNPLLHYLNQGIYEQCTPSTTKNIQALIFYKSRKNLGPKKYVDFRPEHATALHEACALFKDVKVVLGIPFYASHFLVKMVISSIIDCKADLFAANCLIVLVNDSPDDALLRQELDVWSQKLDQESINTLLIENGTNKGFVYSANVIMYIAKQLSAHALLLNSDTIVTPGAITKMRDVLERDDKFGFVNPRSNNATIATIGAASSPAWQDKRATQLLMQEALPPYSVVPVVVGYCLLIRFEVILIHGFLDQVYGLGYNEENDYIMRANRSGYISVLCNTAFVAHLGGASFQASAVEKHLFIDENERVLHERYPEYNIHIRKYFKSSQYRAMLMVEEYPNAVDFMIDLSDMPLLFNGTSRLAQALVPHVLDALGPERCCIIASPDQLKFLGLAAISSLRRIDQDDTTVFAKIGFKFSQPYSASSTLRLASKAAKFGIFWLDTISQDCLYLRDDNIEDLWRSIGEHADFIFFNSPYTQEKVGKRYRIAADVLQHATYHSLNLADYRLSEAQGGAARYELGANKFIIVIGNMFEHKAMALFIEALDEAFFDTLARHKVKVAIIGIRIEHKHIASFDSGFVDERVLQRLRNSAELIVFPSLYEGFGFPIMEALASHKSIIVYDSPLNRDIWMNMNQSEQIEFFQSMEELKHKIVAMIKQPRRRQGGGPTTDPGWKRSADDIRAALHAVLQRPVDYEKILRRIRALELNRQ